MGAVTDAPAAEDVAALLDDLAARGVRLLLSPDGALRVRAAKGAITDAVKLAVSAHKGALLRHLAAVAAAEAARPELPAPAPIVTLAHPAAPALYAAASARRLESLRTGSPVRLPSGERPHDLDTWTLTALFWLGWREYAAAALAPRTLDDGRDFARLGFDVAYLCQWYAESHSPGNAGTPLDLSDERRTP